MIKLTITLISLIISSGICFGQDNKKAFTYVTGRFNPAKNSAFINLDKTQIPHSRPKMYLRMETVENFQKLLADFRKDNPKIKIRIISATRNYFSQKNIWSAKWNGRRKVTGVEDIRKIKDPLERAKIILNYSSMPGTSRHHWGTDFDINSLNNKYFEKGEGRVIYSWLKKNAHRYGFGQPYTAGRTSGYKEEKWHWSYLPLSVKYLKIWNSLFNKNVKTFQKKLTFPGAESSLSLSPVYVNSINPNCK